MYGGDVVVLRTGGLTSYLDGYLQRVWLDVFSAECVSCQPAYTYALPYLPGRVGNATSFNQPVSLLRGGETVGHARITNLGDGTRRIALLGYTAIEVDAV